jgi:hypothetical protein
MKTDGVKGQHGKQGFPNYGRVRVSTLTKSRKGKHHDLLKKIMEDLRGIETGFAVRIPLASVGEVSVLNLRSAIARAAAKEGIAIATSATDEDFFVWKV